MYISTDPVSDMLSRIRNAIAVNKHEISLPHSKLKESVAKLLAENRFIDNVSVTKEPVGKTLVIKINQENSSPRINEITKVSRPGKRHYVNSREIPKVKQGRGIVIISTSKGLMSGDQAMKENIGGELICKVY
jgi:small subunit ribosomal protein S8